PSRPATGAQGRPEIGRRTGGRPADDPGERVEAAQDAARLRPGHTDEAGHQRDLRDLRTDGFRALQARLRQAEPPCGETPEAVVLRPGGRALVSPELLKSGIVAETFGATQRSGTDHIDPPGG